MPDARTEQSKPAQVVIRPPSFVLKEKIGSDMTFAQITTPQVIKQAEEAIEQSAETVLADNIVDLVRLNKLAGALTPDETGGTALKELIDAAFAIKSKAGMCGYPFASLLAKSLHNLCELESVRKEKLSPRLIRIIQCHVEGLKTVFAQKITGNGGQTGIAILAELRRLREDYAGS